MKLLLMAVSIILTVILTLYCRKKYKLTKYQMFLFILLVFFWSAVNIIKSYRKSYAIQPVDVGGLALGAVAASNIAAAYGLISMFMRFPVFYISDFLKSRKAMFLIGGFSLLITSAWVIFSPSYDSLYWSSVAMGLGASMLSFFNVIFSESFSEDQAMISVSILSIAPLLAEFIMSPFQYFATQNPVRDYPFMWKTALVLSFASIVMMMFFKEDKRTVRKMDLESLKRVVKHRELWVYGIAGILVSLIRFAITGSNLVTYVQSPFIGMSPFLVAYIDFIYSTAQLIAGVMAGLYLAKRIGLRNTLLAGLLLSIGFNIILLVTSNPQLIFISYMISGFGYGLTYNSLIGLALQPYEKRDREMSMGIFQTMFSIGIFYGDKIYAYIQNFIPSDMPEELMYRRIFFIILIISIVMAVIIPLIIPREKKKLTETAV